MPKLGNPALIAAALQAATSKKNASKPANLNQYDLQAQIMRSQRRRTAWKVLGIGVGTLAVVLLGKKFLDDYKKTKSESDQSSEAQIAKAFLAAFNPSGFQILKNFDTTKEQLVYENLYRIVNEKLKFDDVAKEYKNISGKDLDADLRSELDADEYAIAQKILASDPDKVLPEDQNPAHLFFKVTDKADVYRAPDNLLPYKTIPNGTYAVWGVLTNKEAVGMSYISPLLSTTYLQFTSQADKKTYWIEKSKVQRLSQKAYNELNSKNKGVMHIVK